MSINNIIIPEKDALSLKAVAVNWFDVNHVRANLMLDSIHAWAGEIAC